MKTLPTMLISAALMFGAAYLPASQAHAIRRSPVADAHMAGMKGKWNRTPDYGHGPAVRNPSHVGVPELDPASAASSIALLLTLFALGTHRRREEEQELGLTD